MKKRCFRLFAGVLALAVMMTYTVIWNPSQAKMTKSKDVKKVEVTNVQGKNITLGKGKKLKLSVNVILKKGSKASKAVKFASSKKSVVTVSKKGVLKAKKIGKAKITVKSKANPAKQVKFTVTVAKKNVLIKKISMKKKLTLHMPLVEEEDDSDDDSDDDTDVYKRQVRRTAYDFPVHLICQLQKGKSSIFYRRRQTGDGRADV